MFDHLKQQLHTLFQTTTQHRKDLDLLFQKTNEIDEQLRTNHLYENVKSKTTDKDEIKRLEILLSSDLPIIKEDFPDSKIQPFIPMGYFSSKFEKPSQSRESQSSKLVECWKCMWCFMSETETKSKMKGPLGIETLCHTCGSAYGSSFCLPHERFEMYKK